MDDKLDILSRKLTETRNEYRHAVRICSEMIDQADTLGAANPDGTFLREQAHLRFARAATRFMETLSAWQKCASVGPPHEVHGDRAVERHGLS
jgi:hypothetical protein